MKLPAILSLLTLSLAIAAHASVTVDIQAGDLKKNTGTVVTPVLTAAPVGSLLLLVAAGSDNQFSNILTAGQYVSGDDVILGAFSMNNNVGGSTATLNEGVFTYNGIGQNLAIRWFPDITFASYNAASPNTIAGNLFGTFAGGTTGTPGAGNGPNGGDPWVVPSDNSLISLNMLTTSLNNSLNAGLTDAVPNSAGYAGTQVIPAIPEPSSIAFVGLGIAGLLAARKRRA